MPRSPSGLLTLAALLLVIWLIWSRLHIVIWVPLPWWGLLLGAAGLFLLVDYLLHRIVRRRP